MLQIATQLGQLTIGRERSQCGNQRGRGRRHRWSLDKVAQEGRRAAGSVICLGQLLPVNTRHTDLGAAGSSLRQQVGQRGHAGFGVDQITIINFDMGGAHGHAQQPGGCSPSAPVDAQPRQALLPAVSGQTIHKGVARRIVALPQVTQQRSSRREEDHEIKVQRRGQLMQEPTTVDLRRQYRGKAIPTLIQQNAVIEDAGCVEDPFEGQRRRRQLRKELTHSRFISHIDLGDLYSDPLGDQLVNHPLLGLVCNAPPPGQDQLFGPLRSQPRRHH